MDDLKGEFNEAAAPATAEDAILEAVARARRSIALVEAAKRQDWPEVEKLYAAGADLMRNDRAALKEIIKSDSPAAAAALAKMDLPLLPRIADYPYVTAAGNGNRAVVEKALDRGLSPETLSDMLFMALRGGRDEIAGLVLEKLDKKDIAENALFALLVHRPAVYDAVLAQKENAPDYLGHFYNACLLKDHAAMEKSLKLMEDNRAALPLYAFIDDFFEDMGFNRRLDFIETVMKSGDFSVTAKFIKSFPEIADGRQTILSVACYNEEQVPGLLKCVTDALQPSEQEVAFALAGTVRGAGAARFFMSAYPEQARATPRLVLKALAAVQEPDALKDAVEKEGYALPEAAAQQAQLLAAAIAAGNAQAEKWLLSKIPLSPAVVVALQGEGEYKVSKRVAELTGEMRFGDDVLFWKAVSENDRAVVDAYPRDEKLSTAAPWLVHSAVEKTIENGDMELLRDIFTRADWTNDSLARARDACLKSAEALETVAALGHALQKPDNADMISIAAGAGEKTLAFFEGIGLGPSEEVLAQGLRIAVLKNAPGMMGYLLDRGVDMAREKDSILRAVEWQAEEPALQTLEKWITRAKDIPAPGLKDDIAAGKPLFGGPESLAIQAAYAGQFPKVLEEALAAGDFDPSVLASTRDHHGNSVLDILGAHGKLGEVLAAPSLWKNRDAVAFVRENAPEIYHGQCDFGALKAALDILRLQERGRQDRFRLK